MNIKVKEKDTASLLKGAYLLSMITIFYNIIEGVVSTYFGLSDDTLALFGFGIDSFVEVLSGVGIAHMIYRMQRHPVDEADAFEKQALQLTGTSFYLLAGSMVISSTLTIYTGEQPQTTLAGIIISLISILTMYFLMYKKLEIGKALASQPIISDANCTKTCLYLSVLVLVSSFLYEVFRLPYVDAIGALGIAWFAFNEGKEAFEKAKGKNCGCQCS